MTTYIEVPVDINGSVVQYVEHSSNHDNDPSVSVTVTPTPILFTAPHSIRVYRDGRDEHKMEMHTMELARALANLTRGIAVTWSPREQRLHGRANVKREGVPLPLRHRDPSYLHDSEVVVVLTESQGQGQGQGQSQSQSNPWLVAMNDCQRRFAVATNDAHARRPRSLHVDLHGMTNGKGADICIGYGAMKRRYGWYLQNENRIAVSLAPVITEGKNRGLDDLILCFNQTPNGTRLSGDCGANSRRNTLTQQSTNCRWFRDGKSFPFALQCELSLRFREHLVKDKHLLNSFAMAFKRLLDDPLFQSSFAEC